MNTLSIQNTQIHQPIPIHPISEVKRDFSVELQRACEELDMDQVINLLNQGASPYLEVELNARLSYSFLKPYMESVFERDGFIYEISTLTLAELQSITDDEKVIERILTFVDALNADPDSVTDLELIDAATTLANLANFLSPSPDYSKLSVMALALMIQDLDLMKALVEAGFDFSDSKAMGALVGHNYTVILTDPETGENRYSDSIGFLAVNHMDGAKTFEEVFSDDESKEDLQKIRELQNQGCILDFTHELGSIFGRVDLGDFSGIVEDSLEIVGFLIEQGVARDSILKLEDGFFEELELDENKDEYKYFLAGIGFEVAGYPSEKNCWDPRTWANDASDEEDLEPLNLSQKL